MMKARNILSPMLLNFSSLQLKTSGQLSLKKMSWLPGRPNGEGRKKIERGWKEKNLPNTQFTNTPRTWSDIRRSVTLWKGAGKG